jgi:hypothetical protein
LLAPNSDISLARASSTLPIYELMNVSTDSAGHRASQVGLSEVGKYP